MDYLICIIFAAICAVAIGFTELWLNYGLDNVFNRNNVIDFSSVNIKKEIVAEVTDNVTGNLGEHYDIQLVKLKKDLDSFILEIGHDKMPFKEGVKINRLPELDSSKEAFKAIVGTKRKLDITKKILVESDEEDDDEATWFNPS